MPLYAFKDNVTPYSANVMNQLLTAQPSVLIFDGTQVDAKTGTGVTDNDLSLYTFMARFTLTGQTTIGRVELELTKAGVGADLTLEIRDNTFKADGTNNGVLLKSITFPAKIFPTSAAYISLPVDLSGLTAGAYYWLRVNKAGDATNKLLWRGEAAADAAYPVYYRSGTSGAWTAGNALHFKVFAATPGTYLLRHGIWGTNGKTLVEYNADGTIAYIWRWLPASDGSWMIVDKVTFTYDANGV
ncbi:MAG: hypothetical protein ACPLRU_03505, partial [Desulfofundulus sp.]